VPRGIQRRPAWIRLTLGSQLERVCAPWRHRERAERRAAEVFRPFWTPS